MNTSKRSAKRKTVNMRENISSKAGFFFLHACVFLLDVSLRFEHRGMAVMRRRNGTGSVRPSHGAWAGGLVGIKIRV